MIPKIIHYCWFGYGQKSGLIRRCISSWREKMPDYQFFEWNESNFDVNSNQFTRDAYRHKKYAYVSDYVRVFALYHHGGIYLDTDVELIKSFSPLLNKHAFVGYEAGKEIGTCVIGAEKGNVLIKEYLYYYANKTFNPDLLIPNTDILEDLLRSYGLSLKNSYQTIPGIINLYPLDYFTCKEYHSGVIHITENTYSIHHFKGSWMPWYSIFEKKLWQYLGLNNQYIIDRVKKKCNALMKMLKL